MNTKSVKNLMKTTGILLIGKLAIQLANFLLLPLYTSVLSLTEYGTIELLNTLSMIIIPLVTLQMEQAIFRRLLLAKSKYENREIIVTSIYTLGITIMLFSFLYFIIGNILNFKLKRIIYFYYLSMMMLPIFQQICRGLQKTTKYAIGTFINSLFIILFSILFVAHYKQGVSGIIWGTILGNSIGTIYYLFILKKILTFNIKYYNIKLAYSMLIYSIPLIVNQISSWIINYSDRWVIVKLLGLDNNGIYSVANKFFLLPMVFFNIYNLAWTESIILEIKNKGYSHFINEMLNFTAHIYLIFINFVLLVLPYIFPRLIQMKFNNAFFHIPILLLSSFFWGMAAMIGSIGIAYEKTKMLGLTTFIAGLLNIIIHLLLIKKLGLFAASYSTLISFVLFFILRYKNTRYFSDIKINWKDLSPAFGLVSIGIGFYYKGSIIGRSCIGILSIIYCIKILNCYNISHFFKRRK